MREPENKKHKILNRAWRLFLRHGFTRTSMRAIAEDAGVSLGLLTYYFTTKDNIALELLEKQIADFKAALNRVIDLDEDPVLYSASLVRINYKVMSMPEFRVFYLDAMRNDLYFKTIPNRRLFPDRGLESLSRINDKYRLGHSPEYLELFGNYLCVSMERTLVLYPDILEAMGHLPDLVFRTYMGHLDPHFRDFDAYCQRSEAAVQRVLREHPEVRTVHDLFDEGSEGSEEG